MKQKEQVTKKEKRIEMNEEERNDNRLGFLGVL